VKIRELTEGLSRYDGLYSEDVKLLVEVYRKYFGTSVMVHA